MDTTNKPRVLVVDDEEGILRVIKSELEEQGFDVVTTSDATDAVDLARDSAPDIAVLDVLMPETNGFQVARALRGVTQAPFVFLTGCNRISDRVRGLNFGADDYVTKPFRGDELSSRLRTILRRTNAADEDHTIHSGDIEIDLDARTVRKAGELVAFSRNEWRLFQFLAAHANRVLLPGDILEKVWGPEYRSENQYLRVWVSRIRAKIEDEPSSPRTLVTQNGVGYMFVTDEAAEPADPEAAVAPV